ncbi:hypothetical protein AK830_g1417 [Neonectria ditissima]|uniref:Apple domain-containing protein n=1 Tax=Neonectria ditissima TaxID=78410 RepID=A0A0P7BEU8_9HYPO|nr:hypothetical protein AK830_g1417 [Neonectria ditissima]
MDSVKSIAIMALFALGASSAPSPSATPVPTLGSSLASCSFIEPQKGLACNLEGDANDLGSVVARGSLSLPQCAAFCASIEGCKSFSMDQNEKCEGYSNSLPKANIKQYETGMFWYDMLCLRCNNGDRVLDLNFEDVKVEDWTLETPADDSFYFDIAPAYSPNKGTTKAFRILEVANEGTATASYATDLNLQAGTTYKFAFSARTSYVPMAVGHVSFSLMTLTISGSSDDAFQGPPSDGVDLGKGWFRFENKFTVEEGAAGNNFLSIGVTASGFQVDWFIDELEIWAF